MGIVDIAEGARIHCRGCSIGQIGDFGIHDFGLVNEIVGISASAAELQNFHVEIYRGLTIGAALGLEGNRNKGNASVAVCQPEAGETGSVAADTAVWHGFGFGVDDGAVALGCAENK